VSKPQDSDAVLGGDKVSQSDGAVASDMMGTLIKFFQVDDWPFSPEEEEPIVRTAYQGQNGQWVCYAKAREAAQQYVFYSICPVMATESKRVEIAEFLTRANYGLIIGNFEMDFNDGEIRYKSSLDVEGLPLDTPEDSPWSLSLLKQMIYANVLTMDKYLPGIMKVIYSDEAPEDAITSIEDD